MRVFSDFVEAKKEIPRDLNELGTTVFAGYQSKSASELDPETFTTKELQNYGYIVLRPNPDHLDPTQPWAHREWEDRLSGINGRPRNPGNSWLERREVWEPLLEGDRKFSYTYSDRLYRSRVPKMVEAMRQNPQTRQAFVSIWDPWVDPEHMGRRRVPCTLGYQVMIRNGQLDITYLMRSSDYATHWDNDVWLALQFQQWWAGEMEVPVGSFTHMLGSLHVYAKEVAHAF